MSDGASLLDKASNRDGRRSRRAGSQAPTQARQRSARAVRARPSVTVGGTGRRRGPPARRGHGAALRI